MNPWSKKRRKRRKEMLQKLAYLDWYKMHYQETADYAIEEFLAFLNS